MVWKEGKSGVHTGRTVRSSFSPKTRSTRREGLLIHSTASTSTEGSQETGEVVAYSLGKQNRWLLPEVIKTNHVASESEVVLVERYSHEGGKKNRRPECFSVYNAQGSTTRKPKRKFAHTNDLLQDAEQVKSRYDVTYPHPSGSFPHGRESSSKRVAAHLGQRRKNCFASWILEQELDDTEFPNSDDEEDLTALWDVPEVGRKSLTVNLDVMISHSTKKLTESEKICTPSDSVKTLEVGPRKGECIYVESDSEMRDTHLELLAQIKASSARVADWGSVSSVPPQDWITEERVPRRRRRGWRSRGRRDPIPAHILAKNSNTEPALPDNVPKPDPDRVSVALRHQEINPAALEQQWGKLYREGSCSPRTFTLNVAPLVSQCKNEDVFVLFKLHVEEDHPEYPAGKVKAFVRVITCYDEITSEGIQLQFASLIETKSKEQEHWSLDDVINVVATCFKSESTTSSKFKVDYTEPRKPKQSLDVLDELFGWNSKTFSVKGAHNEVKKSLLAPETSAHTEQMTSAGAVRDFEQNSDCGICFEELQVGDSDNLPKSTSLTECGHKFCNECWEAHLKTQIQHGQTALMCPGHECKAVVDDVTLMSLLPSWYGRHVTKKLDSLVEINPEWKWCPANQCKLVVKATTSPCSSAVHEQPAGGNTQPVMCVCGNMWCFKCQEDAHWPATCDEALVFRQNNKGYARMINLSKGRRITSVAVKKCPSCQYPIEKGEGCNHMQCGMCHKEFCWFCLGKWEEDYSHLCERSIVIKHQQIKLETNSNHLRSFLHVAVTSRIARSSSHVTNIHRKLDKLEKGLKNFEELLLLKENWNFSGRVPLLLTGLKANNATRHLREVFSFKFQALVALEGAAMTLSFSRDTSGRKAFTSEFDRLFFIVERLSEILLNFNKCCEKESLQRLEHFVRCGKESILAIGRNMRA